MRRIATALTAGTAVLITSLASAPPSSAVEGDHPAPGSPAYVQRDLQNISDAYGRIHSEQLTNPAYLPALVQESSALSVSQLLEQAATPTRPAATAVTLVPGWNVGNPLRDGWDGTRGRSTRVAFTNRYGALLRGTLHKPAPGARDPYTGKRLRGPFPGVVLTPGSVQGSEGMYVWLAQDLAERGYVVLTYDVQGQGNSETLPHQDGSDLPACNPLAPPEQLEMLGCPGVPFQQLSNFVVGTEDALDFFTSTPTKPYANTGAGSAPVTAFNPYWRQFDRSRDKRTVTPGRTTRIAIIGHSMGAAAVSKVQARDKRVATVVALDKLVGPRSEPPFDGAGNEPVVPALAVQSDYGFSVTPWLLGGGSSIAPAPSPDGPDPHRERSSGFDDWSAAGVDSMLIVPRASTHLDYTDIPLVLPASRYGQALTSAYVQRWLNYYLRHRGTTARLRATSLRYLEPRGHGVWQSVTLQRDQQLSIYQCSAYSLRGRHRILRDGDITGVGC